MHYILNLSFRHSIYNSTAKIYNNNLCDGNWFPYDGFYGAVNITLLG